MKIMNFGSLNIDKVYNVHEFVAPGQTIFAQDYHNFSGGKGLNQSVAAARAGATVLHAGAVGVDGAFLIDLLNQSGVDTSNVQVVDAPTGHAVIEVNVAGQNRIIVYGGANQQLQPDYIDEVLALSAPDDIVLLQNETNCIGTILEKAHERGLRVAFNPSPMPQNPQSLPLQYVSYFLVNEIEAAQLAGADSSMSFDAILDTLAKKYPEAAVIMTLGRAGVICAQSTARYTHPVFPVDAVDTTAAGDTFSGYFLSAVCAGRPFSVALREASAASAIAVSRQGAAPSVPFYQEVEAFLNRQKD